MAISENTRAAKLEESFQALQQSLQQSWQAFQSDIKNKLDEHHLRLEEQKLQQERQQAQQERVNSNLNELITGLSRQVMQMTTQAHGEGSIQNSNSYSNLSRLSRVDFPKFDGSDVQGWVYKCESFFGIDGTPDHAKVRVASIHLEGKALLWHQSYMRSVNLGQWPMWERYKEAILSRFGRQPFDDPLSELMKLRQTGSVEQYQDAFDALLIRIEDLPVGHAISCFLSGLTAEIQHTVRMFKPATLHDAYCLAKLQEATLASMARKRPILDTPSRSWGQSSRSQGSWGNSSRSQGLQSSSNGGGMGFRRSSNTTPSPSHYSSTSSQGSSSRFKKPTRPLTARELDDRRAKSLCFYCDEKYTPGHKCTAQVYTIELGNHEEEAKEAEVGDTLPELAEDFPAFCEEEPHISMNALTGFNTYHTMKIVGTFMQHPLHILIDSGSTHNFLDLATAKKIGCPMKDTVPLQISVANGSKLISSATCPGFQWMINDHAFHTDVMIVPLGSCEMILGVQWLSTLGPILWNFDKLEMQFSYQGRTVVLTAAPQTAVQWLGGKAMIRELSTTNAPHIFAIQVHSVEGKTAEQLQVTKPALTQLLQEFGDVFSEPQTLPPHRHLDHHIILKEGVPPINVRPYRYPALQKDVIEKLVQEMLDSGVVRPSQSPYSSPIVLVKKKDGTWRMCVDYRELNKYTIMDKFPIPIIEELLDELYGSKFFSKIDLRSGYWQVRMCEEDIAKTAFRTHEGHYEFVVMPFGLTNAPSTFQALMNHVFKPYLRKFILVFFDDILVYSPTMDLHLLHLRTTLETLRFHTLYAKKSKCSFGDKQVEYLRHIISEQGVATDPQKIAAMQNWPTPTTVKQLRGFLGLTGYYRKFIKGYSHISKPLTELLKKNAFSWTEQAEQAFLQLKTAMSTAPVLALPNLQDQFVIETDASGLGIGAVLMQRGHPLAYISKTLAPRHLGLSTYEKELLALVYAVEKWRPYLMSSPFLVKTDHYSLKYLVDQKISTPLQAKLLPKLLGLDYTIVYKKGKDNTAADALSRVASAHLLALTLSTLDTELLAKIKDSWTQDQQLQQIIADLTASPPSHPKFTWSQGLLKRKGRLLVGSDVALRQHLTKGWKIFC